jgi:aprataxin and PNK-like factor
MARVEFIRVDTDTEDDEESAYVSLGKGGEELLGRGPLLRIDATNISRKHVRLFLDPVTGEVKLTTLHRNPIFVRKSTSDWIELGKNEETVLQEGNSIKFLEHDFHFLVKSILCSFGSNDTPTPVAVNDKADIASSDTKVCPQPTGLRAKKKRKLPDWMGGGASPSPIKKVKNKNTDPYKENVKFITGGTPLTKAATALASSEGWMGGVASSSPDKKIINKNTDPYKENAKFITGGTPLTTAVTALSSSEDEEESKTVYDMKETNQTPINIPKDKVTCQPSTSSKKTPLTKASPKKDVNSDLKGDQFTFPVLVTASDLVDSDEEPEKENIESGQQIAKKKEKVKVQGTLKPKKPSCPYGSSCYRKNPAHRLEEAHPGDPDFVSPEEDKDDDDRPECEFGTNCYRKNPAHRRDFKHTVKPQPKRKAKAPKKKNDDDDLDDSFIDDDDDSPVDDTDDDENWKISSDDDDD